jgi:hypothetical protein
MYNSNKQIDLFLIKKLEKAMLKSLIFLSFFISTLYAAELPEKRVVFLKGVTCSGKTTTSTTLASLDKTWKILSEDDIWTATETDQMEKYYPQPFSDIACAIARENIFHAVRYNYVHFDSQNSHKQAACLAALAQLRRDAGQNKDAYWQTTKPLMAERFLAAIRSELAVSSNIIVDSWYFDPPVLDQLNEKPKSYTLATYAPLPTLVSRLKIRNEASRKSDWKQIRKLHHVISGFLGLYDLVRAPESVCDLLTSQGLQDCFDSMEKMIPPPNTAEQTAFTNFEITGEKLREIRADTFKTLGTSSHLYVKPKMKYQLSINTTHLSPEEAAESILNFVRKN